MPDQIDEAQQVADLQLSDALAAHHRRVDEIRGSHAAKTCVECGEEIPAKRRQAVPGCRLLQITLDNGWQFSVPMGEHVTFYAA